MTRRMSGFAATIIMPIIQPQMFSLRKIFHLKIQDGTLDVLQIPQGMQRNPLPNHNKDSGSYCSHS
jgi:hypothetical protein